MKRQLKSILKLKGSIIEVAGVDSGTECSQGEAPQGRHLLGDVEFMNQRLDDERKFLTTIEELAERVYVTF